MVKPVSSHYNSPKLITSGGYHIGTTPTECATILYFGSIKGMYGVLHMLMEITASSTFRARKTGLISHISPANWSSAQIRKAMPFLCGEYQS